ncbi:MAG: hypothetical protein EOM80_03030 [Erysipelotrichia bacterium]|nr:hypothetical protein [Erysipelotrichia bacterium]
MKKLLVILLGFCFAMPAFAGNIGAIDTNAWLDHTSQMKDLREQIMALVTRPAPTAEDRLTLEALNLEFAEKKAEWEAYLEKVAAGNETTEIQAPSAPKEEKKLCEHKKHGKKFGKHHRKHRRHHCKKMRKHECKKACESCCDKMGKDECKKACESCCDKMSKDECKKACESCCDKMGKDECKKACESRCDKMGKDECKKEAVEVKKSKCQNGGECADKCEVAWENKCDKCKKASTEALKTDDCDK